MCRFKASAWRRQHCPADQTASAAILLPSRAARHASGPNGQTRCASIRRLQHLQAMAAERRSPAAIGRACDAGHPAGMTHHRLRGLREGDAGRSRTARHDPLRALLCHRCLGERRKDEQHAELCRDKAASSGYTARDLKPRPVGTSQRSSSLILLNAENRYVMQQIRIRLGRCNTRSRSG
jgi:hypothetical protein